MCHAAYIRTSTTEQNLDGQRAEIERWLSGHGITEVRWYIDQKSGDDLDRPAFEELQQDIFNGLVKTVCVWKLDRLSRSLQDGVNTLCDWLNKGVRLVSVSQGFDFSGTVGKMVAAVLFAVAEMEQQNRRERQAVGIAAAKKRQVYKGRQEGSFKTTPSRVSELVAKGNTEQEIMSALKISRRTLYRYKKLAAAK